MEILKNIDKDKIYSIDYDTDDLSIEIEFYDSEYHKTYTAIFTLRKVKDKNLQEDKSEEKKNEFISELKGGADIIEINFTKNRKLSVEVSVLGESRIGVFDLKRIISEDYIELKFGLESLAINDKIPIHHSKVLKNCTTDDKNNVIMDISEYSDDEISSIIEEIDLIIERKSDDELLIKGYFESGPDIAPY